jgi:hypothetical protein
MGGKDLTCYRRRPGYVGAKIGSLHLRNAIDPVFVP